MKEYKLNEAELMLPDDWRDNTVNAFVVPSGSQGAGASFVVTRDANASTDEVYAYADQQLVEAAKKLSGYHLLNRHPIHVDGQPTVQSNFTWRTPENMEVQQRQLIVRQDELFLIFTLTARVGDFHLYENAWRDVIGSIRLRTVST